jgi:hypothetical protein
VFSVIHLSGRMFRSVIPGLDPGIPAKDLRWGDPRIKSGDDDVGQQYVTVNADWYSSEFM